MGLTPGSPDAGRAKLRLTGFPVWPRPTTSSQKIPARLISAFHAAANKILNFRVKHLLSDGNGRAYRGRSDDWFKGGDRWQVRRGKPGSDAASPYAELRNYLRRDSPRLHFPSPQLEPEIC